MVSTLLLLTHPSLESKPAFSHEHLTSDLSTPLDRSSTVLLRCLENAPLSTPPSFSKMAAENDPLAASFSYIDSENSALFSLVVF